MYTKDDCANTIESAYTVLDEALRNFQQNVEEVTFFVDPGLYNQMALILHQRHPPAIESFRISNNVEIDGGRDPMFVVSLLRCGFR